MAGDDLQSFLISTILKSSIGGFSMPKFIDRSGFKYGRLTVLKRVGTDKLKKPLWECKCDCGKVTHVNSTSLQTGNTTSCGCALKEAITKHNGTGKGSYNTWRAMVRRCTNPKDKDYQRYGGKGVTVCQEWLDYANFAKDMGEPIGDETLDRINVYGNYEPTNCRWAGVMTQNRNTRLRVNSTTGFTGVSVVGKRYMAKITANKKSYYSKLFDTVEEAAEARKALELLHWGKSL
jgi:hypothetical protein